MAGGSQDFTELWEKSLQIKKRPECVWLGLLGRKGKKQDAEKEDEEQTWPKTKKPEMATGLLLVLNSSGKLKLCA